MMTDDAQLLRRYTEERAEQAFGELVARHIDLVYSAALRVVGGDRQVGPGRDTNRVCRSG